MWRLWHLLFGWNYVLVGWGFGHIIRRIRYTPTKAAYVRVADHWIWLDSTHREIIPLTYTSKEKT